jgi:hypothetical protein
VQLGEVKRGVDVVSFDVTFNLSKLISESLAILVKLLDVAHALAYSYLRAHVFNHAHPSRVVPDHFRAALRAAASSSLNSSKTVFEAR